MKIQYYNHSGFSVELEKHYLVFDYYTGELPVLPKDKAVYVFVSHHHPDHFNPNIFTWSEKHPNIRYILSKDINTQNIKEDLKKNCHFMRGEMTERYGDIQIQTLNSTDCGVAFLIRTEDKKIYHAGDLCLWLWEGMSKEESREMMGTFLKCVSLLKNESIDIAFLTLDNRQNKAAFLNIDYYMKHFDINVCVPMHYFGDTHIADRFLDDPSSELYRDKIRKMEPGDTWESE